MLKYIAPIITIGLLTGLAIDTAARHEMPEGIEAYQARVRDSLKLIPYSMGDWVGKDTEIRQEALKILDANSTLSRVYSDMRTGRTATMLLVQCADARSLLGHYPPVCYPSQGWSEISSIPFSLATTDGPIPATEYGFRYDLMDASNPLEVLHFTVLPDGQIAPNMTLLDVSARDRRFTFYGGASVQFVLNSGFSEEERGEVYRMLFQAATPWISAVQSGLTP